jgi:hypothetical protein
MRTFKTFTAAAVLAMSARAFAAPLPPQTKPPTGPAPQFLVIASADFARGTLTTEDTVQEFVPVQETRVVERDGRKVQEVVTKHVPVYKTVQRTMTLAGVKAYTGDRKPLAEQDLVKRLGPGTVVMVSSSSAIPDEGYLKLVKPDTVLLVWQAPSTTAPPGPPVIPGPKPPPSVPKPE